MWLHGQKPLKVSHHRSKFNSHRDCGRGDLMFLVCHVIFQNHGQPITVNYHPAKFGGHRHFGNRDVFSLSCDLAWTCNQRVMWFYNWEPFMINYYPPKLAGPRHCGSGYLFLVVEKQVLTCCCVNPSLLFFSKGHGLKALKSPILVTCA